MVRPIIFASISFVISFLIFPLFVKIFERLNWFDSPGTHKIHSDHVPSMGGVVILIGSILALLMGLPLQQWITLKYFFISIVLMFLIGLRDDVLALSPRQKLFSQFLPILVLVLLDNIRLASLYELFPDYEFPELLTYFISILSVVIITNAYNLIDGIDGLAGVVGSIALICFGVWFYWAGFPYQSLIALCFSGSLLAFLFFNWQPSRIFMGDTGALTIGLLLSYFGIQFINANHGLPEEHPAKFAASISTAFCVLVVPLFDTLRVILIRLRQLRSPFQADQNHLHHRLLGLGLTHAGASVRLGLINIFFIGMAFLLKDQSDYVILPAILLVCLAIHIVLEYLTKKKSPMYA